MVIAALVQRWFNAWEKGNLDQLPISSDFEHISPYGKIRGRGAYLALVEANREKFLGHRFEIHDQLFAEDKACTRYTTRRGDFTLEVTEWHFMKGQEINRIISYYNIEGEIDDASKLHFPE